MAICNTSHLVISERKAGYISPLNPASSNVLDHLKDIDRNRRHDITIEEVKACSIFMHLTDEQALDVINTVKQLTVIAYEFYQKKERKSLKKR